MSAIFFYLFSRLALAKLTLCLAVPTIEDFEHKTFVHKIDNMQETGLSIKSKNYLAQLWIC